MFEAVEMSCPTIADGEDDTLQNYLDGANVSQDGSALSASDLPADGFFENDGIVGSDVNSWKGNWAFGL